MGRPKVLFLTDSLGLPRLSPEAVYDDDVWVYRVSAALRERFDFFFYTVAGLHTGLIVGNLRMQLGGYRPDVVVLQVGIVDCAPKALKENEYKIVLRLPGFLRERVHSFLRRNYQQIVRRREIVYVSRDQFRANLLRLVDHFRGARWVVIPIGFPNRGYKAKNPLIERNVTLYNDILREVFGDDVLFSVFEHADLDAFYLSDHHHLSAGGHRSVAQEVITRLAAAGEVTSS